MQAEMLNFYQEIKNHKRIRELVGDGKTEDIIRPMKDLAEEIQLYSRYARIASWQKQGFNRGPNNSNNPYKNLHMDVEDVQDIVYAEATYRDSLSSLGKLGDIIRKFIPGLGGMQDLVLNSKRSYKITLETSGIDLKVMDPDPVKAAKLIADIVNQENVDTAKETIHDRCGDYLKRAFTTREFGKAYEKIMFWYYGELFQPILSLADRNDIDKVEVPIWDRPELNKSKIKKISKNLLHQSLVNGFRFHSLGVFYLNLNKIEDPVEKIENSLENIYDEYIETGLSGVHERIKNKDFIIYD